MEEFHKRRRSYHYDQGKVVDCEEGHKETVGVGSSAYYFKLNRGRSALIE